MRRLILLGILAFWVFPAHAAKRVTIAQLEQSLAEDHAAHRPDAEMASRLGGLELSERLTAVTLDRLGTSLSLGPQTTSTLELLADLSAFLDPPASELPATAFPDSAGRQRMIEVAQDYAAQTLLRLPNFFATLTTYRFDDRPQAPGGKSPVRVGLHAVESSSQEVTLSDGRDSRDPEAAFGKARRTEARAGLATWGEFGSVLALILTDAVKGKVTWSHWEQTPAGLAGVFRYSVPKTASHYAVSYCCVRRQEAVHETPGYHGTLHIDPATGAILRITVEAELNMGEPLQRAAIMIEYGPVRIGDRSFICPLRSLALSQSEVMPQDQASFNWSNSIVGRSQSNTEAWSGSGTGPVQTQFLQLNETMFSNYHRLGATARILTSATEPGSSEALKGSAGGENSAAPAVQAAVSAGPEPNAQIVASASQPVPPSGEIPAAWGPPTPSAVPEIIPGKANGVPNEPISAPRAQEDGFSLKVTARLVDVGVVAYDKKGHPVKDLKQEDFEVYDNGRKQEIRFFSRFSNAAGAAPASAQDRIFSGNGGEVAGGGPGAFSPETCATILLIDESHIGWSDLSNARSQIIGFLKSLASGERVGLYTMNSLGFRVLTEITADHTALTARLMKWMPTARSVAAAQAEEARNREQINEVQHANDLNSVNGNRIDVQDAYTMVNPHAFTPVDPQLLAMGSNPVRASLIVLNGVARHLSAIPGHKSLVWISTDNVFADWFDQAVGADKSPNGLDSFALHAQEAMNDAHAAVYPFDISQLESAAIQADMQHRNISLAPAAKEMGQVPNDMTGGRLTAQMHQDLHSIQQPIRQVAEATGGRTIRRAGDLAAELGGIVEDGNATYLLSFTPQEQADGQFHRLAVKTAGGRRGLTLRYRTGYLYEKAPETLKERR